MKNKGYKNISNYFSNVTDIPSAFKQILNSNTDGVFGIELELFKGGKTITIVTPPEIRFDTDNILPYRLPLVSRHVQDLHCYEGFLSKPSFLPLYGGLRGLLLKDLSSIELQEDETIEIQFIFKRYVSDWLMSSIERYRSYLNGSEYPSYTKVGRVFQDNLLRVISKISSFDMKRTYSADVEEKIISKVYKFKLGVTIRSKVPNVYVGRINTILGKYDSHNSISLYRRRLKGLKDEYEERLVLNGENVLSEMEIVSLLGGKVIAPHKEELHNANNNPRENTKEIGTDFNPPLVLDTTGASGSSFLSLLPYYPREEVSVDEYIVTDVANALKRVRLIPQARLNNPSVVSGIRLTTIIADIPKNKNLSHITNKSKDIQASLGVESLSIEQGSEPDTVKFEIPNESPSMVSLRELLEDNRFQEYAKEHALPFVVGLDPVNKPIYLSLSELPHLLVSGSTGSGKSVFLNTLIISIMSAHTPDTLQFFMIDPKLVELAQYEGMAHVTQVETDMDKAGELLNKLVNEMEARYEAFKDTGVKNITVYNQKVEKKMPYIVCVIDEYADLHDTHPHVEDYICRLGQKARASGIHLVIATQRPDAKVLSGRIKTNIQNAISFNLSNNVNYKTVFGTGIPYSLLGRGDGVMKIEKWHKEFQRFQSAIVSPNEVEEGEVYDKIRNYFGGDVVTHQKVEEDLLLKLKRIISQTRETKVSELRKLMGVGMDVLTDLMRELVEEGWLIKHTSNSKGYEICAPEEELSKYKENW